LPGEADLQQEMRGIACSSVGGRWISDLKATTPVAAAARHVLTVRLGVVRDQLPFALHEADKDPEHVHRFRVGTRRARAALDIFAYCLPVKACNAARKQMRGIRPYCWEQPRIKLPRKGIGGTEQSNLCPQLCPRRDRLSR